ncbi:MAG: Membrane proteins related to metalloendopeptidases [uncultured Sphingosinicella sp.]|uniref:Membrane proteins related to metalloendopeptidases n=1 Tax=uncultured Sphingosinicella sp. TaxID=478748 RepID=A0A6J4U596_9SPHN|nr:M23 family metallopeptidase [uncultured Sphingosinicella sp.]CAA9541130.1 MAG: Membrane proteins related to metalloendopeptidases [uncultured Sphingosinicella sp.]
MYQYSEFSAGSGGGAAVLSLQNALHRPPVRPSLGEKVTALRSRAGEIDLVVDLGLRIGSREWFRGLGTCFALCYAAYSFAPPLDSVAGAAPAPLADAQWEESRALAIAPLALGADTGRRMAASDAVEPLADAPERPSVDLLATLGFGDGFARVLERAGVAQVEAARIEAMVATAVNPADIKPGTTMDLTLGRRPNSNVARPVEALSFRASLALKLQFQRVNGQLVMNRIPITIDGTPLRIQGRIGTSLYRSARAAGVPAKAVETYIRAIAAQLDIGSLTEDDRFDVVLEHRRAATGESESGALLYAGLQRSSGRSLQMMPWEQGGRVQWFEASGVGKASGMLQRPVPGSVSSSFGLRRHPILGYTRMHKGMDFQAGYGTPILAATDGRVAMAGWSGGYGKQVRIDHAGGLMTSYSHMSRIIAAPGEYVKQGELIGYVGSTGLSTGPHLHYELHRNGVPINPASVRFTLRSQLDGPALAAFRSRLQSLLAIRPGVAEPVQSAGAAKPGFSSL